MRKRERAKARQHLSSKGNAVIGEDLIIQGELRSRGDIDVLGYVTGSVIAQRLTVGHGGKVYGTVRAESAEVNGVLQGTVAVRNLIRIGSTGSVNGDVRYGQLALDQGGELSADVHNVPPELAGDFNIVVRRGRSVRITTEDLNAIDPDSGADVLVFSVARSAGGHVARASAPGKSISHFTQAELQKGEVIFVHDGGTAKDASLDVSVADQTGASSGAPKTVTVTVTA